MLRLISTITDRWMGYMCLEGRYLEHTEARKSAVDLLIMDPHHVDAWPVMAGLTLSCVNGTTAVSEVSKDIMRLFDRRKTEKDKKHAQACFDMKRSFLAMVFTTEGSACPQFFAWWVRSWNLATALHVLAGGNARTVARAKQQSMASLQAIRSIQKSGPFHLLQFLEHGARSRALVSHIARGVRKRKPDHTSGTPSQISGTPDQQLNCRCGATRRKLIVRSAAAVATCFARAEQ